MRLLFVSLALLLGACVTPAAVTVSVPPVSMTVDTFGQYLDPYGAWVTVPGYSQQLWQPSPNYVGADFYPYGTGGQWVYTNAGWFFDSDYPFGWAVFHYGRWMRHVDYGWLWLPGSEWGSSWVSWRYGGAYIGWAPLGPYGPAGYQYADWCFVPTDHFTVYNSRAYTTGPYEFHHAVASTELPRHSARVGPPPTFVARATGAPLVPVPANALHSSGRVAPAPPPPGSALLSPMQAPKPQTPMGWREMPQTPGQQFRTAPPSPGVNAPPPMRTPQGFSSPPQQYRTFPPSEPQYGSPQQGFKPPPPQYRSAPPPPASQQGFSTPPSQSRTAPPPPSSQGFSAPPPQYRSAPAPSQPTYRSAPIAPPMSAPPPMSTPSAPPPPAARHSAPAPAAAPMSAPPPMHVAPPPPPSRPR